MEYSVKARLVSVSVEVAYTDPMNCTDTTFKDTFDEQLHLHLAGTILSFAVSFLPLFLTIRYSEFSCRTRALLPIFYAYILACLKI